MQLSEERSAERYAEIADMCPPWVCCEPAGGGAFLTGDNAAGHNVDGKWISNVTLTDTSISNPGRRATLSALAASMRAGNVYVSVYAVAKPGGVLRGQVEPIDGHEPTSRARSTRHEVWPGCRHQPPGKSQAVLWHPRRGVYPNGPHTRLPHGAPRRSPEGTREGTVAP